MSILKPFNESIDKKSAIKLINSYAESYKLKEEQNSFLLSKIKELESNLTLKKEIISSLTSSMTITDKMQQLLSKLNNEIDSLTTENRRLAASYEEVHNKVMTIF